MNILISKIKRQNRFIFKNILIFIYKMNKGIIYLIQPSELVGTERYKIGCSRKNDLDRVKKGYKKGTRYLCIMECIDPFKLENIIKKNFNDNFKLISGNEYYEGDEFIMKNNFLKIIDNYNNDFINKKEIKEEITDYESDIDSNIEEIKNIFNNYDEDILFGGNKKLIKINIYENNDFQIILKIKYIDDNKEVNETIIDMDKKDETKCYYYLQKLVNNKIIENDKIYDLNNDKFIKKLLKYKHHNNVNLLPDTITEIKKLFYTYKSTNTIIEKYFFNDTIINDDLYVSMSISNNFFEIYHTLHWSKSFSIVKINNILYDLKYIKKYVPYNIRSNDENYYMLNRDYEYIGMNTKSLDFKFDYNDEYIYGDDNTCYNLYYVNNKGFKNIIKNYMEITKNKICLNPNNETNKLMTLY